MSAGTTKRTTTTMMMMSFISRRGAEMVTRGRRDAGGTLSVSSSSSPLFFFLPKSKEGRHMAKECVFRNGSPRWGRRHSSSTSTGTTSTVERAQNVVQTYKDLSKFKLSAFVVSTAAAGAIVGTAVSNDESGKGEKKKEENKVAKKIKTILDASFGTALCAFSANSLNQILERKQDGMMARTMRRPLPSGRLSVGNAMAFAVTSGICGTWYLNEYTNETTAMLGGGNILLYACVYTPLKQVHWLNTWVGAVVGAIPPMMGYAAASDFKFSNENDDTSGSFLQEHLAKGMVLPLAVYLWQMPHFMALATMGRDDYIKGGYRMLTHPSFDPTLRRAGNVAVRNSLMLLPLGFIAANVGLVSKDSTFRYEAIALGAPLVATAFMFRHKANITSARRMFYGSLAYLPLFQTALCIRNRQYYYSSNRDEKNEYDGTNIAKILMTPIIALHDLFAVNDSCPQVVLAEDKEHEEDKNDIENNDK